MMWNVEQASELYHINEWGGGFFRINQAGNVQVSPTRDKETAIDLKVLVDEVQKRGVQLPILFRFSDVLRERIGELHDCFQNAIDEFGYKSRYRGVYPIKVNQQSQVVESILSFGKLYHLGLEAGSKPELLTVMSLIDDPEALILCNGYKDEEFIELALLGKKLGKNVIIIVEKYSELKAVFESADRLNVRPGLGIRVRLSSRGAGRWEASGGDRAKFGLGAAEILKALDLIKKRGALDELKLLHYHLGSQVCSINTLKAALREAGRYYVELKKMGAGLQYFDCGGGLAVDYDGSRTNFFSSANYSLQEYANSVVNEIGTMCNDEEIDHPILVTESGRALTAYHSILVTNVLGVTKTASGNLAKPDLKDAPPQILELWDVYENLSVKTWQESWHDVQDMRQQLLNLFKLGYISLAWRAVGESIAASCLRKIQKVTRNAEYVPDELDVLERELADIYFCNFSIFQSLPDAWAIGQVFPIMPIHRLNEKPGRRAVLADVTCDSDGKIDKFVDLRDVKQTLPLHDFNESEDYLLGCFLVGAYQEILGDLHNLFGDNNAVQVSWDGVLKTYRIDHVEDGDTVTEVLNYVQQSRDALVNRFRKQLELSVRQKIVTIDESRIILEKYRDGFSGYTYLER